MAGGITKEIVIDEVPIKMRASAALIYRYKLEFKKDLLKDVTKLAQEAELAQENAQDINLESLQMFLELAYLMAKSAEPNKPENKNVDTFLDQFNVFSIYTVLPEIIELWGLNMEVTSTSKKNLDRLTVR